MMTAGLVFGIEMHDGRHKVIGELDGGVNATSAARIARERAGDYPDAKWAYVTRREGKRNRVVVTVVTLR